MPNITRLALLPRTVLSVRPRLSHGTFTKAFASSCHFRDPNGIVKEPHSPPSSTDRLYESLGEACFKYLQKESTLKENRAQAGSAVKPDDEDFVGCRQPLSDKCPQYHGSWNSNDSMDPLDGVDDPTGDFSWLNSNAEDPFGCDSADMREAKANSKYAWVTCETEFEKYVLQAQNRAYFFVERTHDIENPKYSVGVALSRQLGDMQGGQTNIDLVDTAGFPFMPRNVLLSTDTLEEAFQLADVLVERMITDEMLLRVLRWDAKWRNKLCSIAQLNMLLKMQWAYNKGNSQEKLRYEKLDLFGKALTMNSGQMSCLLSALLLSRFDPEDNLRLKFGRAVTSTNSPDGPQSLVQFAQSQITGRGGQNNFWEGWGTPRR